MSPCTTCGVLMAQVSQELEDMAESLTGKPGSFDDIYNRLIELARRVEEEVA